MKSKKRSSRMEGRGDVLVHPRNQERIAVIKSLLHRHRIHTRDIVNGKDFLFSGPSEELHIALRELLEIEHSSKQALHFDFAKIDQYFLLRITGSKDQQDTISEYFEHD